MDLPGLGKALWRFKWVSIGGFMLACLLAVYATARISFSGISYRTPVIYTAETKILVTQAGFPLGRTILSTTPTGRSKTQYADPGRFVQLAGVYATLADSDQIQRKLVHPKDEEQLIATPEVDTQTQTALPIIDVVSLAPSQRRAVDMARQATSMLDNYLETQQKDAGVPAGQRVLLQTLQQPYRVTVAQGRKKTVPIVVFMTVLLATIGLVLGLENIRPRVRLSEVREFSAYVPAEEPVPPSVEPVSSRVAVRAVDQDK